MTRMYLRDNVPVDKAHLEIINNSKVLAQCSTTLTAFIVNLLIPDLVRTFTTTFRSDGLGRP